MASSLREQNSPNEETVQTMASALINLLETRLQDKPTVDVRTLLLGCGSDITTDCLVLDNELGNVNIKPTNVPYWLNYLLLDIGWRGQFRLFKCMDIRSDPFQSLIKAAADLANAASLWSLSKSVVAQTLVLATAQDFQSAETLEKFGARFAKDMERATLIDKAVSADRPLDDPNIKRLSSGPFLMGTVKNENDRGTIDLTVWSRSMRKKQQEFVLLDLSQLEI